MDGQLRPSSTMPPARTINVFQRVAMPSPVVGCKALKIGCCSYIESDNVCLQCQCTFFSCSYCSFMQSHEMECEIGTYLRPPSSNLTRQQPRRQPGHIPGGDTSTHSISHPIHPMPGHIPGQQTERQAVNLSDGSFWRSRLARGILGRRACARWPLTPTSKQAGSPKQQAGAFHHLWSIKYRWRWRCKST